jgi:hypothetical protein
LRERWSVALVVATLAGILGVARGIIAPDFSSDLDQLWYAARALAAGNNPYGVVGPGQEFEWAWPVFYPLPAILLVLPFSFLPVLIARMISSVFAGGVLGFAMGSRWRVVWPLFLSEAYFLAISRNQWAPFMLAAIWFPAFGFFAAAKPNIGVIATAAQTRATIIRFASLAVGLVVLAFLVRPSWLGEWLSLVRTAPNKEIALLQPGGFLLLGALIVWRSAEGRILLATSAVPQTPSLYDLLLLFALCRTRRQALVLAVLTHALQWSVLFMGPFADFNAYYDALAKLTVGLALIPVMLFALANHGVFRKQSSAHSPASEATAPRTPALGWIDGALLFLLLFAFSLQLLLLSGL